MLKRTLLLLGLGALPACASEPESTAAGAADAAATAGRTLVYECSNGRDFIVRSGPGEMALWLEDRYLVLSQVRSGSGTRYEEGEVVFWSKGEEAMLDVGEEHYRDCEANPRRVPWEDARRRGIDFRGIGNEPGWHVEVHEGDSILFVGDYGATRTLFRDPVAVHSGNGVVYSAVSGGQQIEVRAVAAECLDSMAGDRFPMQVEVSLDARHYRGCGMLLDHPWE